MEGDRSVLNIFGAVVVTVMMLCYAWEARSPVYTLGFAIACLGSASYGFLAGTWPFGVVETVWAVIAFRKWMGRRQSATT
jgi:CHASE2 domain-containing sensor protein